MKTVLITGGSGLIGKALSHALLKKGYAVIILSREKRVSNSHMSLYGLGYARLCVFPCSFVFLLWRALRVFA